MVRPCKNTLLRASHVSQDLLRVFFKRLVKRVQVLLFIRGNHVGIGAGQRRKRKQALLCVLDILEGTPQCRRVLRRTQIQLVNLVQQRLNIGIQRIQRRPDLRWL